MVSGSLVRIRTVRVSGQVHPRPGDRRPGSRRARSQPGAGALHSLRGWRQWPQHRLVQLPLGTYRIEPCARGRVHGMPDCHVGTQAVACRHRRLTASRASLTVSGVQPVALLLPRAVFVVPGQAEQR